MSGRASAARYARALLDVAIKEADPARVGDDLVSFAAMVSEHAVLRDTLKNPGVPAAAKRRVIEELSGRLSLASPLAKLLLMLADRDRLMILSDLSDVYQERLREHQRILQAEVTTAAPLEAEPAAALRQRLQDATGRQVTMTMKVDPALIGGLVARIGGTVYDGSVSARLTKMRERLMHER
jgi:F-type H+-transporting ATPase subunit delta